MMDKTYNNNFKSVRPVALDGRKGVYIETYGCQMNVNDSEVILSILEKEGFALCGEMEKAGLVIINTCAIRDNAEQRIWGRLDVFRQMKARHPLVVCVVGCMAERLKDELLKHKAVDIVAGPDSYRKLPALLRSMTEEDGRKQIDVMLSSEETYADISPVRMDKNGVSAFISIMRGCNNVCSYCVVPYTRGIERSRDPETIIREARELIECGYKEINLLGQNVDSYLWKGQETVNFASLLRKTAEISPDTRIRFSTSHPKDISDEVLYTMARYDNICKHIHLPVQSGSSRMLELMRRKYDRDWYLERIRKIREIMPDCSVTTDVIAGFCTETEEDHRETLSLMEEVRFDGAFMFQYSERPGTLAARRYKDDVPPETKTSRLNEIIALQNRISLENNQKEIGKHFRVLVEGHSKRDKDFLSGRASNNKMCVFPSKGQRPGEYAEVRITGCTSATLIAENI